MKGWISRGISLQNGNGLNAERNFWADDGVLKWFHCTTKTQVLKNKQKFASVKMIKMEGTFPIINNTLNKRG